MNKKFSYLLMVILLASHVSVANAGESDFFATFDRLDRTHWYYSNGWVNGLHQACEWREDALSIIDNNLQMKLSDHGGKLRPYGCPEIHTKDLTGYGFYEARMKTAAGSGLNTNLFTYVGPPTGSPEHDEIDFEFLGKDPSTVQLNYYTNGQGHHEKVISLGFDASKSFHDYAIEWSPQKIRWYIDKNLVYETPEGSVLPRNPTRLYLSLWAGTDIEDSWLGKFDYTLPKTAEVNWAAYTSSNHLCKFKESVTCK